MMSSFMYSPFVTDTLAPFPSYMYNAPSSEASLAFGVVDTPQPRWISPRLLSKQNKVRKLIELHLRVILTLPFLSSKEMHEGPRGPKVKWGFPHEERKGVEEAKGKGDAIP